MKKYVIERDVPGIGGNDQKGLSAVAHQSNGALAKLRPRIQWQESYVTGDKTYCIYLADDEAVIREHARLSGFPANVITEVKAVIDPATDRS
jgi:site-specific DNA-cytosine methylase